MERPREGGVIDSFAIRGLAFFPRAPAGTALLPPPTAHQSPLSLRRQPAPPPSLLRARSADKTSLLEKDKVEQSSKILMGASLAIASILSLL